MINFISVLPQVDCQRIFHGRGHAYKDLHHINIDWLKPVLLITLYDEVNHDWLMQQAEQIKAMLPECISVQVQYRCRFQSPTELLLGEPVTNTIVTEQGCQYHIQFGRAQNTGLFLDMANGRSWVKEHCNNCKVLNLFAYTCAFSVVGMAGGAKQVVNIDLSKASLSTGRENHRLNKQNTDNIIFESVDIFKSNSRIKKYGKYDLLICDPPSFQKGSVNIERDYKKIIRRIPDWMNEGADILLCLNSPDLDQQFIHATVAEHCPDCEFVEQIANPEVFKEAELGKGLKTMWFRYRPQQL